MPDAAAFVASRQRPRSTWQTTSAGRRCAFHPVERVANGSGKKIENRLRIDFTLSQIEVLWIQPDAHPIVETCQPMRALNSSPVTVMVYGFDPSGNYWVTPDTCLSSRVTSGTPSTFVTSHSPQRRGRTQHDPLSSPCRSEAWADRCPDAHCLSRTRGAPVLPRRFTTTMPARAMSTRASGSNTRASCGRPPTATVGGATCASCRFSSPNTTDRHHAPDRF
jgi:hypothetical protein